MDRFEKVLINPMTPIHIFPKIRSDQLRRCSLVS